MCLTNGLLVPDCASCALSSQPIFSTAASLLVLLLTDSTMSKGGCRWVWAEAVSLLTGLLTTHRDWTGFA